MPTVSDEARAVLRRLKEHGNVLIIGAPATGKTRLLLEVREAFAWTPGASYNPQATVPLPAIPEDVAVWLPSPERPQRKVFETVFHQKFGNGNVVAVDGNKLTIQFDKAGEKRVVDSFVELV